MRTSTQRCSQKWHTLIAGGFKTFLVLFLLSFFATNTNAQIVINGQPGDWCTTFGYPSGTPTTKPHLRVADPLNFGNDDTEFNQGTKDVSPLDEWHWGIGVVGDKTDLGNVGLLIENSCNIYFFADRYAADGDADLGLWLFKDDVSLNPDGTFSGVHTDGDMLITSKFTNGGGNQFVRVYEWQGNNDTGSLILVYDSQTSTGLTGEQLSGVVNTAQTASCFPYQGKGNGFPANTYAAGTFFEGHLDLCALNALVGSDLVVDACFSNFIFKTSQSQEPTSANGDLAFGSINSIPAEKTVNGGAYCSGGSGFNITLSDADAGVSYQLQKLNGATWENVGAAKTGADGSTIDFDGLQLVGSYRVFATTVGTNCTAVVGTATVSEITANGGTGSPDQTLCGPSVDPTVLSVTGASTGTYQWQSNTTSCAAGSPWANISGATSATYDPPAGLTTTTYYRRVTTVTSGAVSCPANSTCITVTINNVTGGTGSIDQTLCGPSADPAVLSVTGSTSTQGTPTYKWQSNTTSCAAGSPWADISGATSATYDPPAGLTTTTYYRRVTTSTVNSVACSANSTCITVTINNVTGGTGSIDQTHCGPADPTVLSVTGSTSTQGTPTYKWQSNTTSCAAGSPWADISGATSATYDPPAGLTTTTYYRRVTTSTVNSVACSANSTCITVNIGGINAGTIAQSQTLCSPANPALFTSTADATGATTPTYQWESKLGTCASENAWAPISGATSSTYDAPAGLTATTSYRRVATSTLNGVPCSAASNCITVTVKPTPAPPVLTVVNNCGSSTITARDAGGALIPGGELTWTGTSQTGNPIIVTTTTAVTATRTVDGCTSGSSNSVTPAPKSTPGAPTGVPASGCIGQRITLGASGCTGGTLTWYATNSSTEVLGTGTTFTTPALNENATYYVSCTVEGCTGPRTPVTASVTACGSYCTYTQGAWGTLGGKMCDGEGKGDYSTAGMLAHALANWGGTLWIGSGSNKIGITSGGCVLDLLPGGGKSYALTGSTTSCDEIKSKYAKLLPSGYKINNTLLAQTITLGLNLGINDNLASFSFATHSATNKYLITQKLASCGSTSVVPNTTTCDLIDPAVIALLKQSNWPAGHDYPATVSGLFSLANYALGGGNLAGTGVTLESIAGVVDAINNAFDECRAFVNFAAACPQTVSSRVITAQTESSVVVTAAPNPYTDRITFVITSKISGQGALEIYNSMGQKISTPFRGYINAGRGQTVNYNVPQSLRGNLFYKLSVKDRAVSGKVLSVGK